MKMTQEELTIILDKHKQWVQNHTGGEKANFACTNLSYVNLAYTNLRGANFTSVDLVQTNLSHADLYSANFAGATLKGADLKGANLKCADLAYADLRSADLSGADLTGANLTGANLMHADCFHTNFTRANLRKADLTNASFWNANFTMADLSTTDIKDAKYMPYIPMACPEAGAFIGWKKVNNFIVQLQIPAEAKRSSATGRKCRCEYARVLSIERLDGTLSDKTTLINTSYCPYIPYIVGEIVRPDSFDENRFNECSHGIHFFINRQEAVDY